ncbi:MAG: penicillin-binding protein 2, partial [Desulfobacterales bacterium]|nr:penicillin-binding protein 2 [Desulfobacterales bacterium]
MNVNEKEKKRIARRNRRIFLVCCVFTLCYLVIACKAFYLQVFEEESLSRKASGEYSRLVTQREKRGTIYDVKSRELAVSTGVVSVGAHPDKISKPARAASVMAEKLGLDRKHLMEKLNSDKSFVWIQRDVSPDRAEAVKREIDSGLELINSYSRVYPNKTLAAQVLGFTGVDGHGLEGLEYYYDDYLRGDVRQWKIVRDAMGRIFNKSAPEEPGQEGKNLILTMDSNIQYITEKALKKAVLRFNAESGMAMVMVPQTGAVRAIAHYPTFNPNAFSEFPRKTWRNRAITDSFEPGSTFKIFLAAAALESGLYAPTTMVDCEGGSYTIDGTTFNDTHSYEELSLLEVVKYSSNIGAVKIAESIGPKTLYDTLRDFGFGRETKIDCPGEASGILRHYRSWREIDNATIAFGQGVSVTAVQLLTAVSAIANHGLLMKPRIAKAVTNPDGSVFKSFEPEMVRRVVSAGTADKLKNMMRSVTEPDGTGHKAAPEGYSVCGKTGTAQILNKDGTYKNSEYNALFVGFVPARSPELAVLVVVKAPKVGHYGGEVAAPSFAEIVRESFNYMNIAPAVADKAGDKTQEE